MIRRLAGSTIARLALAVFLLQLLSGAAALALVRAQVKAVEAGERRQQIVDARDELLAAHRAEGLTGLERMLADPALKADDPQTFILLHEPGRTLTVHGVTVLGALPLGAARSVSVIPAAGQPTVRALAVATPLQPGVTLVVGSQDRFAERFDSVFAAAAGLSIAITALIAVAGAAGVGIYIDRLTREIAMITSALASGNLAARADTRPTGDGFAALRLHLNSMAEKIDGLVAQLHTVTVSLAHDLLSPIARLRARIDAALARTADPESLDALGAAHQEAQLVERMLNAALELSQLESGAMADRRQPLDLGAVVEDVAELFEPVAESRGMALRISAAPAVALADRELLARALANLIDNAIKYGRREIAVECRVEGDSACIVVTDDGPGISAEQRHRAVERFTRLENARTEPGAGLGLAMANAVAAMHGGALELSDAGEIGLRAVVRLPLSPRPA